MTVSKDINRNDHSSVTLTLTVTKDSVQAEYDAIIKNYSASIQIKGFRKGKVPRDVLERKFGEALKSDVLGQIMEKALESVFAVDDFPADAKPIAYSTPEVQDQPTLDLNADLSFAVKYDVFPTVTLGAWKGITIEAPIATVAKDDIDRELEQMRDRNAVVLDKDEKAAIATGDIATVDYAEIVDGAAIADTARQDFVFTIGTGYNVFKIDDDIIGMKKGESRDIVKTYGDDCDDSQLRGQTKTIRVTVKALKEKKLPELDDELAQDISEKYATLADLRADVKANLERNLETRLRELKVNAYLEQVLTTTSIDLPESMIRIEQESRWRQLARRFNTDSDKLFNIIEASGKSYEGLMAEWRPDVEKALKSRLIVETLMKEFNPEVSDADLENEFASMAASMSIGVDEVKKHYAEEKMLGYLRSDLKERRLFDSLLAGVTIKPGKKANYLDLVAENR